MTTDNSIPQTDNFHIGNLIRTELDRQGRSITWLAEEVHYSRENLYKIFRRPWINTDLLFRISDVLHHDFFEDCSYCFRQSQKHPDI